jgi:Asp-tRNA(Asn)/Glu-tRNA(Gln) amidotransferase B subunit
MTSSSSAAAPSRLARLLKLIEEGTPASQLAVTQLATIVEQQPTQVDSLVQRVNRQTNKAPHLSHIFLLFCIVGSIVESTQLVNTNGGK